MRQVLIVALLVVAALAATNCSTVSAPSGSADYYMPPKVCVDSDTSVRGCLSAFDRCVGSNGSTCTSVTACHANRIKCLDGIILPNSNCTGWLASISNAVLYLLAGGAYKDSSLENACKWALCSTYETAFQRGVRAPDGILCQPDFAQSCVAPTGDSPTRSPNQAVFSLTFGGAEWVTVLQGLEKTSPRYREIETAIQKGLARLLDVLEYLIDILEMRAGSLVVTFIVNDPSANTDSVMLKLQQLTSNNTLVASIFTELAVAVPNIALTVTGVGVQDFSTPAPPVPGTPVPGVTSTPAPEEGGDDEACNGDCKVGVIVAVIGVVLIAIIIVSVVRGRRNRGTGTTEPAGEEMQRGSV